ncbi:MAG: 1-pyrroline-5-carboxylate dehydrogenase, partial [Gemmatimonas sp.]|nr:1-pyrroline-5-carboxylate dehydrogenase [Gemmatimonas sp.]
MSTFSPNGVRQLPPIVNEPIRSYAPGSPERASLQARIKAMEGERPDIAVVVHGEERRSGKTANAVSPHKHQHVTATWHHATAQDVHDAIESGKKAYKEWSEWTWEERAAVFLKAADLLAGPWRDTINAATMLGQSKNVFQSEIDAACEMTDFFRFNVQFARELYSEQPISGPGMWNQSEYRALEGFVYAVTPFNFTAIGGNLAGAPALMGNTVLWKPAASAMLSAWYTLQLLHEAGLPKGVINFLPGDPVMISDIALKHRDLAGVHFTGSTGVFNSMWNTIGSNMSSYRSYPRIVGETGGKDFMIAHASADVQAFAVGVVRGAFEYQGQKCSACSRIYVPKSIWPEVKARITAMIDEIKVGDTNDFSNFMGAVIDQRAFDRISNYLADAKQNAKVIAGGTADGSTGWFVKPTLVETTDPKYRLMCEEIFGPIVTAYVYDDAKWEETLKL